MVPVAIDADAGGNCQIDRAVKSMPGLTLVGYLIQAPPSPPPWQVQGHRLRHQATGRVRRGIGDPVWPVRLFPPAPTPGNWPGSLRQPVNLVCSKWPKSPTPSAISIRSMTSEAFFTQRPRAYGKVMLSYGKDDSRCYRR